MCCWEISSAAFSCSGTGIEQEDLDFRRPGFDQMSLMGAAGKEGWVLYNKEPGLIKKGVQPLFWPW